VTTRPATGGKRLSVVLCWHFHQPWYLHGGRFVRPWVYLHALASYGEMARHVAEVPGARAVFNFSPVLIEQIERYRSELDAAVAGRATAFSDPLLDALYRGPPAQLEERVQLIAQCCDIGDAHPARLQAEFSTLRGPALAGGRDAARLLNDAFVDDIVVAYHLSWLGETVRRSDAGVVDLLAKGAGYSAHDRRVLLDVVAEELRALLPRYRRLAEQNDVELSASPWSHPILPLLIDVTSGREALPDLALPDGCAGEGGQERARWQIVAARETFERTFGVPLRGCFPPAAAISTATLTLLSELGLRWCASSRAVLVRSAAASGRDGCAAAPYLIRASYPACFFRDDGLSDRLAFSYPDWDAAAAVTDLIARLEDIARRSTREDPIVTLVIDGENPWRRHADNGCALLRGLYAALVDHPTIAMTTFSEHLDHHRGPLESLDRVVAGSWADGHLSPWVGHPAKNALWLRLDRARRRAETRLGSDDRVARLLAICEGSDWLAWANDDTTGVAGEFTRLFEDHLATLLASLDGRATP
jgi:alpha-amylase/alpha-mannosidase (GH57 family)